MRAIYLLVTTMILGVILLQCTTVVENNPINKPDKLATCRIIMDSTTIQIPLGEKTIVKTDKGDLEVMLSKVDDACSQDECKTCDILGNVYFQLKLGNEIEQISKISVGRCSSFGLPIILKYNSLCSYPVEKIGTLGVTFSGNLILAIRELSPYPKSLDEMKTFSEQKKYVVNLIIKNRCNP
jgi:hypothetical protein